MTSTGPPWVSVPHTGDVHLRLHREGAAADAVRVHERLEEIAAKLVLHPVRVEFFQRPQEAGRGELRHPHRVQDGQVRSLAFGYRPEEDAMQVVHLRLGHQQ